MGKKKGNKNRGGLGEDFEDSYEYDYDGDDYQGYGKSKKNKRRNRDSRDEYDHSGYGDYDDQDSYEDHDSYDDDQESYDGDQDLDDQNDSVESDETVSASSSALTPSASSYSEAGSSSQKSFMVDSGVFKESKPSPLSSMHPGQSPSQGRSFDNRSGFSNGFIGKRPEPNSGFKTVVAKPETASDKTRSEEAYEPKNASVQTSGGVPEGREEEPVRGALSRLFRNRGKTDSVEETTESRKGIEENGVRRAEDKTDKAEKMKKERLEQSSSEEELSEEEQMKQLRIGEINDRIAQIDADIDEYRQICSSDEAAPEDVVEAGKNIDSLKAEKKKLKEELRELSGSGFAIFAKLGSAIGNVAGAAKRPFLALKRRRADVPDAIEGEETPERNELRDKNAEREERAAERQRRKEEKKRLREERKRQKSEPIAQDDADDVVQDAYVEDADSDAPTVRGRNWMKIAHRAFGVTIVATVIMVACSCLYVVLPIGGGKNKNSGESPADAVAATEKGVGVEQTANPTLWNRLAKKFSKKNSSELAKKEGDDADASPKESERFKERLDSFGDALAEQTDALKEDLAGATSALARKADEFGSSFSEGAIDSANRATASFNSAQSELNDVATAGKNAAEDLSDDVQDASDEIVADVSSSIDSLDDALDQFAPSASNATVSTSSTDDDSLSDLLGSDSSESINSTEVAATEPEPENAEEGLSEPVDIDPEVAELSFGSAPTRNASSSSPSVRTDELDDQVDGLLSDFAATSTSNESGESVSAAEAVAPASDASTGADWGAVETPDVSNATISEAQPSSFEEEPQETNVAALGTAPLLSSVASQAPVAVELGSSEPTPSSLGSQTSASLSASLSTPAAEFAQSTADSSTLNGALTEETPSLASLSNPQTDSLLGSDMNLVVGDASNATLELNDESDLNALSGAVGAATDDFDSWNATPVLSQEATASTTTPLASSLNRLDNQTEALAGRINEATESFQSGLQERVDSLNQAINSGAQSVNEGIASLQERGRQTLEPIDSTMTNATNALQQSRDALEQNYDSVVSTLNDAYQSTADSIQSVGDNISANFQNLQNSFAAPVDSLGSLSGSTGSTLDALNTGGALEVDSPSLTSGNLSSSPTGNANAMNVSSATSLGGIEAQGTATTSVLGTSQATLSETSSSTNATTGASLVGSSLGNISGSVGSNRPSNATLGTSNVGANRALASGTSAPSTSQTTSSDTDDLIPLSVDYSYSMSPLGRASSRTRISSSTLATPTTTSSTTSGVSTTSSAAFQTPNASRQTVSTSGNGAGFVFLNGANGSATTTGYREYVTKEGDNLLTIAERELGSSSRWGEIKRLNNLRSGATYFASGTTLLLPVDSQSTSK